MGRVLGVLFALAAVACGGSVDEPPTLEGVRVSPRTASVIVEGCTLDPWQRQTLQSPGARMVLREIILLCPSFGADGAVAPTVDSTRAALRAELDSIRASGYRVTLALRAADERGVPLSAAMAHLALSTPVSRARIVAGVTALADGADGIEVAIFELPDEARRDLVTLLEELAAVIRPGKALSVFAPPSIADPSDLPGGEAWDLRRLPVDRVRLMTLDYSCCGAPAGPTTDPGWMVDAARLAMGKTSARVDVAYPLYGYDFFGNQARPLTFFEARGLAAYTGAKIERGPTFAPKFSYSDSKGMTHEVWFDDATSTVHALAALGTDVLPSDVGVVFYGLGAEDPALFTALARAMR